MNKLFCLIWLFIVTLSSTLHAKENPNKVELIAAAQEIASDEESFLALKFTLEENFHSYWFNPGEVGMVTNVIWEKDDNIEIGELLWPMPSKLDESGLTSFVYEEDFALLAPIKTSNLTLGKKYKIEAIVTWLICKDVCIPFTQKVRTSFIAAEETKITHDFEPYKAKIPSLEPEPIEFNFDQSYLWLELPKNSFYFHSKNVDFFPEQHNLIDYHEEAEIRKKGNNYYLIAPLYDLPEIDSFYALIKEDINFWRIQAVVNSDLALPLPETPFNLSTFFLQLLFAFIGGLILNLMPCVFPVLSLKALHIAKSAKTEHSKIKIESLSYSLGVIISFLFLSLIIVALKEIGYEVGWGFQMQSASFVTILIVMFFVIGLNLSGFFEVKNKFANWGNKLTQDRSNLSSFFTGLLATSVATPCTAPFMATALGFALAHNIFIICATFIFLGLGLSFPILLFTFFPKLVKILPKPGVWLENFKQFLAFPIFLTVIWLIFVLSSLTELFNILWLQVLLIYLAFTVWLFIKTEKLLIIKILSLVGLIYFAGEFHTAISTKIPAEAGNMQRLSTDKQIEKITTYRNEGKRMFVNVTADWCITCKVNEQAAIEPLISSNFFAKNDLTYIQLDWTKSDAEITKFLNSFERSGVPLYVYFDEYGTAHLLPQLLTTGIIKSRILD